MITFICDKCTRPLEVDDDQAGRQVACPHCWHINVVPTPAKLPPGVIVARPASTPSASHAARASISKEDKLDAHLAALNLPPASSKEQTICVVHPVMFRAKPWYGLGVFILMVGGAVGGVLLFMSAMLPLAVVCACLLVIGLAWAAGWKMHTMSVSLTLTNKRAIQRQGLLSRSTVEAVYEKIIDVEVHQTLWQRMTAVGTLGLDTAAEDGVEIELHDLPDPKELRRIIDAYRGI